MSMFDYVFVLVSIIIGLAMTHLLQGVAGLIQHPKRERIWWVHLVWVAFMFFSTIFWWWFEFRLRVIEDWTFSLYWFVILYAFVLYLLAAMLFPKDLDGYEGFRGYFLSRRHWFFSLMLAWTGIDLIDTWLKGAEYFESLGLEYHLLNAMFVVLSVGAMWTRNATYHAITALAFLGSSVNFAVRLFSSVT